MQVFSRSYKKVVFLLLALVGMLGLFWYFVNYRLTNKFTYDPSLEEFPNYRNNQAFPTKFNYFSDTTTISFPCTLGEYRLEVVQFKNNWRSRAAVECSHTNAEGDTEKYLLPLFLDNNSDTYIFGKGYSPGGLFDNSAIEPFITELKKKNSTKYGMVTIKRDPTLPLDEIDSLQPAYGLLQPLAAEYYSVTDFEDFLRTGKVKSILTEDRYLIPVGISFVEDI